MVPKPRTWTAIVCAFSVALFAGAFTPGTAAAEDIVVAIPVRALANSPFLLGLEKGFYEEEGLNVKLVQMRSAAAITGMITGDVTVDFHTSAIRAPVGGKPVRMIGYLIDKTYFGLYAKPEIRRVEELKNGVLAVTDVGGSVTYILQKILDSHGLRGFGKDVTMFPSGSTQNSMLALLAGKIDGTLLGPERGIQVEQKGYHEIARASDYVPLGMGGMSTGLSTLKDNPGSVKKFLRATLKSLQFVRDKENESTVVGFFRKLWNLSEPDARTIYRKSKDHFSPDGSISREGMELEIELVLKKRGVEKKVPIDDVADFRLLKEVQAELKL